MILAQPAKSPAVSNGSKVSPIVGSSPAMRRVVARVSAFAPLKFTVLIVGPSGSGKEPVARMLHDQSPRAQGPFCAVNCAAIPRELLESELFGVEKGAVTGVVQRTGLFDEANGGTLFLDEIAEMDLPLQAKLLRVLQSKTFYRVGGNKLVTVDVRIVAATNREPAQAIADKKLRLDVYHRLNQLPIRVPPLSEHRDDVPDIARSMLVKYAPDFPQPPSDIAQDAMNKLQAYSYPGGVRELENILIEAMALANGEGSATILLCYLREEVRNPAPALADLAEPAPDIDPAAVERQATIDALNSNEGRVSLAAKKLGIGERGMRERMKRLNITKPSRRSAVTQPN
jgi:transcriptional regulator with PAS, ATPase and Fis domain